MLQLTAESQCAFEVANLETRLSLQQERIQSFVCHASRSRCAPLWGQGVDEFIGIKYCAGPRAGQLRRPRYRLVSWYTISPTKRRNDSFSTNCL